MENAEQSWLSIPSRRDLIDRLERVELSADAKIVISKLLDTTIIVGQKVFEIGKQVVAFVFDMMKRFRGIAFGVGLALTVSYLVASTPLIGGALAALLTPLLLAFGLVQGALEDVRNGALRDDIARFGKVMEGSVKHV